MKTHNALTGTLACAVLAVVIVGVPIAVFAEPVDDTTAPATTFNMPTTPASGWFQTASVPVRLTASDADSGVASITYVVNDGEPVTTAGGDVTLALTAEGVNAVTAWATDVAGNDEPTKTHFFRIDRTAPEVELPEPTLVERGAALPFDYRCTDTWSGVVDCISPYAVGGLLPTDELGEHEVVVTATDVAGSSASGTYRYAVAPDLTAPEVSLMLAPEPASGWYTTAIGIGVVASDPSGIASRHWWTDGAVSTNGDVYGETEDAVFTLDFEGITDITYSAYDNFGNRSGGTHRVRIDTVAPSVWVGGALPAAATIEHRQGERVEISARCDDATSGVAECRIVEAPSGVVPTTELGDHTLTIVGTDAAGNRAEAEYAYRVVAGPADPGDPTDPVDPDPSDDGETPTLPTSGGRPGTLASTGVDLAGAVLVGGLLAGAGLGMVGARRMLRR